MLKCSGGFRWGPTGISPQPRKEIIKMMVDYAFWVSPLCIRMLHKAQIAWELEHLKPLELPVPLSGSWTPAGEGALRSVIKFWHPRLKILQLTQSCHFWLLQFKMTSSFNNNKKLQSKKINNWICGNEGVYLLTTSNGFRLICKNIFSSRHAIFPGYD